MSKREIHINVRSMFGYNTQRGLVMMSMGEERSDLTPAKAREIGHWLLEAAEAAEQDQALVMFSKDKLGLDNRGCAALLQQLRESRQNQKET